jgi:hypothetical protein
VALADEWLRREPGDNSVQKDRGVADQNLARLRSGRLNPVPLAPLDIQFSVRRVAPRKLEISGTVDALNLSRVQVVFRDRDYERRSRDFDFKMNECTLESERVSVNKMQFKWLLNLDRDPADMDRAPSEIYPLKADEYELTVSYNPRLQAAFIQDRYGWHGEGLTGKPGELIVDPRRAGVMFGREYPLRMVSRTIFLKRDDILASGQKTLYPPAPASRRGP